MTAPDPTTERTARLPTDYIGGTCEGRHASPSNPNQTREERVKEGLSETVIFRCTVAEKAALVAKADAAGLPNATLMREALGLVQTRRRKTVPRVDPSLTMAVARVGGKAIVVTGATDAAEAAGAIDRLLPPPGAAPVDPAPLLSDPRIPSRMIYLHVPQAEKSTLAFIGLLPDASGPEAAVDLPIVELLGGGADSPLFTAIRQDLGATYGMGLELAAYSRSQRVLAIHGEIETEKMRAARDAVLATYAAFLDAPDTARLADITTLQADEVRQDLVYVDSSAATLRELLLQGRNVQDYHRLADHFLALTPADVQARLAQAFPRADALAVFAAGPDPEAFPEACVITAPTQAVNC